MKNNNNAEPVIHAEEFAVAEKAAANSGYEYKHIFARPFTYEGKTYKELVFDWGSLTGEDSLAIENEMSSLGKPLIAPEFSGEYLIRMAARACNERIGSDALAAMPLVDYNKIRNMARSFLLRSGQ